MLIAKQDTVKPINTRNKSCSTRQLYDCCMILIISGDMLDKLIFQDHTDQREAQLLPR